MTRADPTHLVVGLISKAHGTKGEVYVESLTDHPQATFVAGVSFELGDQSGNEPDPAMPDLILEAARPYRKGFLVKFEQVDDRTAAEFFRGRYLLRALEDAEPLEEDEVFYHQLLGMRVSTVDHRELGQVIEVYELHPAWMLEVRGPEGMRLIPFAPHVVAELDVDEGRIVIDPPEGLLDL